MSLGIVGSVLTLVMQYLPVSVQGTVSAVVNAWKNIDIKTALQLAYDGSTDMKSAIFDSQSDMSSMYSDGSTNLGPTVFDIQSDMTIASDGDTDIKVR